MLFLFFIFSLCPIFAQNAPTNQQVDVKVNFSNLQFGKPFTVDYTAPMPVVEILSVDTNTSEDGRTSISLAGVESSGFRIQASAYSARPYPFPSLLVTALDDKGNTNIFYTPSFNVPISNALANNTNKLQLIDIVPAPFVWNHLWTIFIAIILWVIALIILLNRYKNSQPKAAPQEDPFLALGRRLKALETRKNKLTDESYKEFFVELSETLRELLSLTIAPLAMESPTREILDLLKKHKVSDELFDSARLVLRTCDAAKYAKAVFPSERTDEAVSAALSIFKRAPRPSETKDAS